MTLLQLISDKKTLERSLNSIVSGKTEDARNAIRGIDKFSINSYLKSVKSVDNIASKLQSGSYTMSPTKAFFFRKSTKNDYRLISPPCVEDAIVQNAMLTVLKPIFRDMLNNNVSYCGVPSTGKHKINHVTALRNLHEAFCKGHFYIFKSDIDSFYNSIRKDIILSKITSILPDNTIDNLIKDVIYFKVGNYEQLIKQNKGIVPDNSSLIGIAQGSPLSPFLSNIYLADADASVRDLINGQFFRYVDDFLIVAKNQKDIDDASNFVKEIYLGLNLTLAERKTDSICIMEKDASFIFLGLKISKYEVMQKKPIDEVIKKINSNLFKARNLKKRKNISIIDDINNRVQGYANYYRNFHTVRMLRTINQCVILKRKFAPFKNLRLVDESGDKQFMSKNQWKSAFKL